MRAKVVKGIDVESLETDIWMIMIQKEKNQPYSICLRNEFKEPYWTHHKSEAEEKVKKLNDRFSEKERDI